MIEKVLVVDDEENILNAMKRHLRKQFRIETASDAKEGLERIAKDGPYSVILSDLRMPGMDGIEFLSIAREMSPHSVRMMLTGNADLKAAIEAVNEGNIFRFLTKPCHINILAKALNAGIEQYRLITAERELLEKTLMGSINILIQILELVNPEAFGRSSRIKQYVHDIALCMKASDIWRLETAAMLSQIGSIILPEQIAGKISSGESLTEKETRLFEMYPSIASDLISNIPRMKKISEMIAYQEKHFDGSGFPRDTLKEKQIPLGARILKVALDFDSLEAAGYSKADAISQLVKRSGWYDPDVLTALVVVMRSKQRYEIRSVTINDLNENMTLEYDLQTLKGQLLTKKGQKLNKPMIARLKNFAGTVGIREPIRVVEQIELKNDE